MMQRTVRIFLLVVLLLSTVLVAAPAQAQTAGIVPGPCNTGTFATGDPAHPTSLWMYCVPASGWNGDLVVFAHGFTDPRLPLGFQNLEATTTPLPALVQSLGFAFATTSYRKNGLAILEGMQDIEQLVQNFPAYAGRAPQRVFLAGASEGGLVTTLLIEQKPQMFSGGLAACGPIGDFKGQINYLGDFRTLFDYFFPGLLAGDTVNVPAKYLVNNDWENIYWPQIAAYMAAHPGQTNQLIKTAHAAVDPSNPATALQTAQDVLWYDIFAITETKQELGGNPYGNRLRWYSGSKNDLLLNARVKRYTADPAALQTLNAYQTSGNLTRPLVTLHTTGDDIVPFWHEALYTLKTHTSGNGRYTPIPILGRYGHCNFTDTEVLAAFGILYLQVAGQQPAGLQQQFSMQQIQQDWAKAKQNVQMPNVDRK